MRASSHGIPFYSHWPETFGTKVAFQKDTYAMDLDLGTVWPDLSQTNVSESARKRINDWLKRAPESGERLSQQGLRAESTLGRLEPGTTGVDQPPMALMATNVVWDLASMNRQQVFESMSDWVLETVSWFIERPQYRLIIRPHTVERDSMVPRTTETVESIVLNRFSSLPSNILLDSEASGPIYRWISEASCVLVHTSTVGLEAACLGKQVIVSGSAPYCRKGFTSDPVSRSQYFGRLESLLIGQSRLSEKEVDLAFRFADVYLNGYYINLGLFKSDWTNEPQLMISELSDLMPGKKEELDWVLRAIMNGDDILTNKDRKWPS